MNVFRVDPKKITFRGVGKYTSVYELYKIDMRFSKVVILIVVTANTFYIHRYTTRVLQTRIRTV